MSYKHFIAEAETTMEKSSAVSSIVSDIRRNYEKSFAPEIDPAYQFLEEKRKWPVFDSVKSEEIKEATCSYYVKVSDSGTISELALKFLVKYSGKKSFDSADPDMYDKEDQYAVSLDDIKILGVRAKSEGLSFDETNITSGLKKTVLGLLLTILTPEFDMIADEDLIIRQL